MNGAGKRKREALSVPFEVAFLEHPLPSFPPSLFLFHKGIQRHLARLIVQ